MIKRVIATSVATSGLLLAGAGMAVADAGAEGAAAGSPGVLSGNQLQVPVHIPVNACGNTVDVVGALNPAFGNHCANTSKKHVRTHHRVQENLPPVAHDRHPAQHRSPAPRMHHHHHVNVPAAHPQLAKTGGDEQLRLAAVMSAGLLTGGFLLYRRGRRLRVN